MQAAIASKGTLAAGRYSEDISVELGSKGVAGQTVIRHLFGWIAGRSLRCGMKVNIIVIIRRYRPQTIAALCVSVQLLQLHGAVYCLKLRHTEASATAIWGSSVTHAHHIPFPFSQCKHFDA